MKVLNLSKETVLAGRAALADTAAARLRGLLGRSGLGPDEGLVITRCRSIHMFFMRFPIDAVFVDRKGRIVGLVEDIRPFRISPYFWRADYVVEGPVGMIRRSRSECGDRVAVEP